MRIERSQDVDRLLPLAEKWAAECHAPQFGLPISVEPALEDLRRWLAQFSGTLLLAWSDDDVLLGFFGVFIVEFPLAKRAIGIEKYWYALPNGDRVGPALFRAAQEWVKEQGASHLIVSASRLASDQHDKIVRFCERKGMELLETSFIGAV